MKLLKNIDLSPKFGFIININSTILEARGLKTSVGDIVKIISHDEEKLEYGMVVEVKKRKFLDDKLLDDLLLYIFF